MITHLIVFIVMRSWGVDEPELTCNLFHAHPSLQPSLEKLWTRYTEPTPAKANCKPRKFEE